MGEAGHILLGGLSGAVFGVVIAMLGGRIGVGALRRRGDGGVMAAMAVRMVLDAAALGAVFFARNVLPLPFEPTMIGTALGLSVTGILLSWKFSRRLLRDEQEQDARSGGGK